MSNLQWVKCSERMPIQNNDEYFIRQATNEGYDRWAAFYDHKEKEFYLVKENCSMDYFDTNEYPNLEWLDEEIESPASPVDRIGVEAGGWISVDEPPKEYRRVLVYFDGLKEIITGSIINGKWCGADDKTPFWCLPSHWMPLPTPPSPTPSGGAPIEQEKKATSDETVSDILEVQLQKEIEFYRERMNRAMYELNIGTKASCFQILYDALLDDRQSSAPVSPAREPAKYINAPEEIKQWIRNLLDRYSIAEARAGIEIGAKEMYWKMNAILAGHSNEIEPPLPYPGSRWDKMEIKELKAENTALQSKIEALERELEELKAIVAEKQAWINSHL